MQSIHAFSSGVLAEVIRRQPDSPSRTNLAWQIAVGPALARATTAELVDGVLHVRARDPRWLPELRDARPQVLQRVQRLLGPGVKSLNIK